MKRRVFALVAALATAASCSSAKTYEMRGQILGINRDKMEILVKHEEIPGLMAAMTMPWKVQHANMLDNLGPGDLITSEIVVENNQGVITKITKLGTAKPDMPAPGGPAQSGVKYLTPGDTVPNQAFIDQHGNPRDLNTVRGNRALAITFIYTKCPIPTFCPAMDRQFAEAQALIKEKGLAGKAGLLSVSFDPKNDTPAVLTQHADKLGADPKVWTFVTGDREAIDRFASSLLLTLVRGEAANPDEIGHTLRTTVIDKHGKIAKSYSGADWTPAELVADLERLL
ncbi:MAG TPA: SCO family protein [Vicinamibacterales bacterium]|nr:SCO family protein [Vicinamibacterales bacterium]